MMNSVCSLQMTCPVEINSAVWRAAGCNMQRALQHYIYYTAHTMQPAVPSARAPLGFAYAPNLLCTSPRSQRRRCRSDEAQRSLLVDWSTTRPAANTLAQHEALKVL
jgi:hypothetical protein